MRSLLAVLLLCAVLGWLFRPSAPEPPRRGVNPGFTYAPPTCRPALELPSLEMPSTICFETPVVRRVEPKPVQRKLECILRSPRRMTHWPSEEASSPR